jgi:hypothetical protein
MNGAGSSNSVSGVGFVFRLSPSGSGRVAKVPFAEESRLLVFEVVDGSMVGVIATVDGLGIVKEINDDVDDGPLVRAVARELTGADEDSEVVNADCSAADDDDDDDDE